MQAKLNSAYYYGNKEEGLGSEWSKNYITEIVGQPIYYTTVISFDGFIKVIDTLGGINVDVERDFTDPKYPIKGKEEDNCGGDPNVNCRWEYVSFKKGLQHFDGATALKYVRSRHAQGDEGTDYARSARQQRVIFAIKEKVLSPPFFLNPSKVDQTLSALNEVLETNITETNAGALARVLLRSSKTPIKTEVLSSSEEGKSSEEKSKNNLLINPPISKEYGNQWVLIPSGGSWDRTHRWVSCLLEKNECTP
jgi:LCP family protein required for cell wall assembly